MVAVIGSGWRLAPCLVVMFEQADARWPNRSRASDGSIGDRAHAARASDHNPSSTGFVTAGDLTDDKDNGCDADAFAEHLRQTRDRRVKYVICNGRVFRSYGSSAWQWTPYTGPNGHFAHTHVSVLDTAEARNDLAPWFPPQDGNSNANPEEDEMPPSPAIVDVDGLRFVFVRGTDAKLYMIDPYGSQHDYGGILTSGPSAVVHATDPEVIEVAARGQDGATWVITVSPSTGKVVKDWASIGGQS